MENATILLVDDDEALLEGMHDLLELSGYHAVTAENGVQAVGILEASGQLPDLIVSDITMPGMDGYQLLEEARARDEWKSIPFIFLTARSTKKDVRSGKKLGADDYVAKPFDADDLLVAVESLLKRRSELDELRENRFTIRRRRILAAINHEFRTPLSYVVAYSDMITSGEDNLDPQELREYVAGIQKGSERLFALVENLLLLVELESGQAATSHRLRKGVIYEMDNIVADIVSNSQPAAENASVTLSFQSSSDIAPVEGDVNFLSAAIRHLIENAIKFTTGKGSAIEVSLKAVDNQLAIAVQDDGIGISSEEQEYLFELFYQANREKLEQQGVGAGLAIVSHVASLHDGKIEVESIYGEGACFTLLLPVYQGEEGA